MSRTIKLVIFIVLLVFLLLIVLLYMMNRPSTARDGEFISPQTVTPTIPITPTSQMITITGTIDEQVGRISYKNSMVFKVNGENVYITDETLIVSSDQNQITVDTIPLGAQVNIVGQPTEGGVEAKTLTITSQSPPSDNATPSADI